ncbi:MAG: hypothetical protein QM751_05145 [Paludibacteraceae bacterium]
METALEIPATYWLNLQNQYDIDFANINEKVIQKKKDIEIWDIISNYVPVKVFLKLGNIE